MTTKEAILHFAKVYQAIIKEAGIYRTAELMVIEIFLNKFNYVSCSDSSYEAL